MMPIRDASRLTVDEATASAVGPNGRMTLYGWLKPLSLNRVIKKVVDFEVSEVQMAVQTEAVMQPFTEEMLQILPEGERSWRWLMVHATPDVELLTDDVLAWRGDPYRVMGKLAYDENGYAQYRAVNDYDRNPRAT